MPTLHVSQRRSLALVGERLAQSTLAEDLGGGIETALVIGEAEPTFAARTAQLIVSGRIRQAALSSLHSSQARPPLPTVEYLIAQIVNLMPLIDTNRLLPIHTPADKETDVVQQCLDGIQALAMSEDDQRWIATGLTVIAPPLQLCRLTHRARKAAEPTPFVVLGGMSPLGDDWRLDNDEQVRTVVQELVQLMRDTGRGRCTPETAFEIGGELHDEAVDCLKLALELEVEVEPAAVQDLLRQLGEH